LLVKCILVEKMTIVVSKMHSSGENDHSC
jgi:hypothetical protein